MQIIHQYVGSMTKYLLMNGQNVICSSLKQVTKLYYQLKVGGELHLITMIIENHDIIILNEN